MKSILTKKIDNLLNFAVALDSRKFLNPPYTYGQLTAVDRPSKIQYLNQKQSFSLKRESLFYVMRLKSYLILL